MNKVIYENNFIKVTDTEQDYDYRVLFENKTDRPITVIGSDEVENVEIPAYNWIGLLYGEQALEWIKIIEAKDFCIYGQGKTDEPRKDAKTFYISITETLNRIVEVRAENEYEAIQKVSSAYYAGDIVLDSEDFVDTEFEDDTERLLESYDNGGLPKYYEVK